jgi:hypothetical protein
MKFQGVNVNHLNSKMNSKKELFNFLLHDCLVYMPPMIATHMFFLLQIMRGPKEVGAL